VADKNLDLWKAWLTGFLCFWYFYIIRLKNDDVSVKFCFHLYIWDYLPFMHRLIRSTAIPPCTQYPGNLTWRYFPRVENLIFRIAINHYGLEIDNWQGGLENRINISDWSRVFANNAHGLFLYDGGSLFDSFNLFTIVEQLNLVFSTGGNLIWRIRPGRWLCFELMDMSQAALNACESLQKDKEIYWHIILTYNPVA
jgi:hypothetical protein